jgi:hypothetical protein
MQVSFYLPEKYLPDSARQEAWKSGTITTLEEGGKIASAQAWIYQTWLELYSIGCPVELTHTIPADGILITLAGCVGTDFRPGPGLYFADIVADSLPHPGAHCHLVQNAAHARLLPRSIFTPHWPQPNLLPRDPERGNRFETLGFYGAESNLAPELRDPAWQARLRSDTGLSLQVLGATHWHDYRITDCVLAVRSFDSRPHLRKPSTKLYNAWLAGVPFVGGMDSAYQADGEAGTNYLAVSSLAELDRELRQLAGDEDRRRRLVEAGRQRGEKFHQAATRQRWKELVTTQLPAAAEEWSRRSPASKKLFSLSQATFAWLDHRRRA